MSCDVAVVGGELAGLAAAAFIAHSGGRRVVVLEDGDTPDVAPIADRLAPTVPALWRAPSHGASASLIDGLGLKQDVRRVIGDPVGLAVLDDPDIRMSVPLDPTHRTQELLRVFGAERAPGLVGQLAVPDIDARDGLLALASALHEDGFFQKRAMKKRVLALGAAANLDDDDDVRALGTDGLAVAVLQLAPLVQSFADAAPTGLAGQLAKTLLAGGVAAGVKGGLGARGALRELLASVVRGHGGEVLRDERIDSVAVDGKHILSLKTSGANDWLARVVVDATSRRDFTQRLSPSRRREKLLEEEGAFALVRQGVSVRWVVPQALLPRGLAPLCLALRPAPEFAALVGIFGGAPQKVHQRAAPDDGSLVVVASTLAEPGHSDGAARSLTDTLRALLPFCEESLRASDRFDTLGLVQYQAAPTTHALRGRRPLTPFANLLRAGRDLAPVFGIDGELVAARSVAAAAQLVLGTKKAADAA